VSVLPGAAETTLDVLLLKVRLFDSVPLVAARNVPPFIEISPVSAVEPLSSKVPFAPIFSVVAVRLPPACRSTVLLPPMLSVVPAFAAAPAICAVPALVTLVVAVPAVG
jgi:hypothetical protein